MPEVVLTAANLDYLLGASEEVRAAVPDLELALVGAGTEGVARRSAASR